MSDQANALKKFRGRIKRGFGFEDASVEEEEEEDGPGDCSGLREGLLYGSLTESAGV